MFSGLLCPRPSSARQLVLPRAFIHLFQNEPSFHLGSLQSKRAFEFVAGVLSPSSFPSREQMKSKGPADWCKMTSPLCIKLKISPPRSIFEVPQRCPGLSLGEAAWPGWFPRASRARTQRQPVPFELNSAKPFKQYFPKLRPKLVCLSHRFLAGAHPVTTACPVQFKFCQALEGWGWRLQNWISHRQVLKELTVWQLFCLLQCLARSKRLLIN